MKNKKFLLLSVLVIQIINVVYGELNTEVDTDGSSKIVWPAGVACFADFGQTANAEAQVITKFNKHLKGLVNYRTEIMLDKSLNDIKKKVDVLILQGNQLKAKMAMSDNCASNYMTIYRERAEWALRSIETLLIAHHRIEGAKKIEEYKEQLQKTHEINDKKRLNELSNLHKAALQKLEDYVASAKAKS